MADTRPVYSIGAAARMIGVPVGTLRTWEDRYGLIVPERSPGGHRLYSRDQIDELRFVASRVADGIQPGDAHRMLEARRGEEPVTGTEDVRLVILLAERDPHAAALSEYFLKTEGYETLVTLTAEQAEEAFERGNPQIVVVDLLISGGEGLDLCRRLSSRNGVGILAVSSLSLRDEALDAGADAFLQKPLDPLQLVSAVRDVAGESAYLGMEGR